MKVFFCGSVASFVLVLGLHSAQAFDKSIVHGVGDSRNIDSAKFLASLNAKHQCLDLTGSIEIKQISDFSIELIRPYDNGIFYYEADAQFQCGQTAMSQTNSMCEYLSEADCNADPQCQWKSHGYQACYPNDGQ